MNKNYCHSGFRCGSAAFAMALAVVCAFVGLSALADVPVLTSSLEYVGNPAKNRWPTNAYYRGALDLQFHRGALLVGSGEVESNPGPIHIYSTDPVTLQKKYEYSAGTEAVASCRVASWGELHVYIRGTNSVWRRHSGITGSVPEVSGSWTSSVLSATHVWDMEEFDGRIFAATYQLNWSTNRCASFVDTGSITNAHQPYSYWNGSSFYKMTILRRQMQLLRFGSDLYAAPNFYLQPNYKATTPSSTYNQIELFRYDSSTKKFVQEWQHVSTVLPDISSNDYRLVLSSTAETPFDALPVKQTSLVISRLWRTTPFKGRVLYVGCYDTTQGSPIFTSYPLPLMGCSATVTTSGGKKTLKATRLSFDGDKEEYPWDFVVVGDTVYALTSKPNATTKVVRHSVWKSTDGLSFTRVLTFDFHQNMISLDYRDGWFWFGVGVKNATRGYAYDSKADEAGAIYRVRLPQEPTSVEAVEPPTAIAEGGSASIAFRLTAQPASNLVLRVAARASQNVTLDKSTLTFTPDNWSTPQAVTVSMADDRVPDDSPVVVTCGAGTDDVERGEFSCTEVTSAPVVLSTTDNDISGLENLLRDESNRGTVKSNAKGGNHQYAYDNKSTEFGGYTLPVYLTYQFKTAQVVNGIGVKSVASGDETRHASTIRLYGSNNGTDFTQIFSLARDTNWKYGKWRRWVVANTNAYSYYKIELSCIAKPCFVQELALYSLDLGEPAVVVPQPEFATGGALAPHFDSQGRFTVSIGNAVNGGRYRVYATESLSEPFEPVGEIVTAAADGVLDFAVETAGKPSLFIKVGSAE